MDVLLVFIKNPQLGRVKTRLAESIGEEAALAVYLKLLHYTRTISEKVDAERFVYYADFIDWLDQWSENHFNKKLQTGENLGERMANAFQFVFPKSKKAIIIGSDCAELDESIIQKAYEALDHNDVVIGPAKDGGYYLLGMNRYFPELFQDISWSTTQVFPETVKRIEENGLSYALLDTLSDIDYENDWVRFKDKLSSF